VTLKIIAVGNAFFGDDGIGTAVLESIRQEGLFPGAELVDIQTDALALLEHLVPGEWNVIVDAAKMGLDPGEAVGFTPAEIRLKIKSDPLSTHGFGLAEVFAMATQLNKLPERVLIVGVEPERIAINQGLSDAARKAVPRVIAIIQAEVQADG
jgi:hydrogenase maturation protease